MINVATQENALSGANGEIATNFGGTQAGDIVIAADVEWSADTILTLTAANDIGIFADVTETGKSAGLVMNYGRDYSFAEGGAITLAGNNASLTLNGTAYTLIQSFEGIQDIDDDLVLSTSPSPGPKSVCGIPPVARISRSGSSALTLCVSMNVLHSIWTPRISSSTKRHSTMLRKSRRQLLAARGIWGYSN